MIRQAGISLLLALILSACHFHNKDVPEGCMVGVLSDEGGACQTMTGPDNKIFSFFADMNGFALGETVCVCGTPALMSRCKTGQPLDLNHLGHDCPGPPPAYE